MTNLEQYTTYTRSITLAEMLKVAELDLPLVNDVAKSCDWLPRVSGLAFGWHYSSNSRKTRWLLNIAVNTTKDLTQGSKPFAAIAGFQDRDRIRLYNKDARVHTLSVAMLVRKAVGNRQLTDTVKKVIEVAITDDAVLQLSQPNYQIELTYTTPLRLSQNIFDRKLAVTYDEAIAYVTFLIGKTPSRSFMYKYFNRAKTRLFSQIDCEFLANRLQNLAITSTI